MILTFTYRYYNLKKACRLRIQQTPHNCLFLLTSYVVLDYHFEQVIISILNLHVLAQQFINWYISSIKETNWLRNKGMHVHLFYVFKHLQLRKTYRKNEFLGKKIRRNALALKSKKVQSISGKVYFGIIIFSCLSSTKLCLRFLLNCFVQEIKGFYQSSIGNEVYFRDIMNISPNILAKN